MPAILTHLCDHRNYPRKWRPQISSTWQLIVCYSVANFNFYLTVMHVVSKAQADKILLKINAVKQQQYLRKQELVYCVHDTATQLLSGIFLHPVDRLSKCLPFFRIVILMTFVCILKVVSPVCSNFICTTMVYGCKYIHDFLYQTPRSLACRTRWYRYVTSKLWQSLKCKSSLKDLKHSGRTVVTKAEV